MESKEVSRKRRKRKLKEVERKGRWRGRGRVTRGTYGSPAIINAASAAIIHTRVSKIGDFRSVRARLVEALEAQGRDGRQIMFPRSGTVRSKRSWRCSRLRSVHALDPVLELVVRWITPISRVYIRAKITRYAYTRVTRKSYVCKSMDTCSFYVIWFV